MKTSIIAGTPDIAPWFNRDFCRISRKTFRNGRYYLFYVFGVTILGGWKALLTSRALGAGSRTTSELPKYQQITRRASGSNLAFIFGRFHRHRTTGGATGRGVRVMLGGIRRKFIGVDSKRLDKSEEEEASGTMRKFPFDMRCM